MTDWDDYESGPFCRHWSEMGDCDQLCGRCGHSCNVHDHFDEEQCNVCDCPEYQHEGETSTYDKQPAGGGAHRQPTKEYIMAYQEFTLPYDPNGNTEVTSTGMHADDSVVFTFTPTGPAGASHVIQAYPLAGDYDNAKQYKLKGPGGSSGPLLWGPVVGKSPPCRIVVGPTTYTRFGDTYTLYQVGVEIGKTYAFTSTKDPAADPYTGPQNGNITCTLNHGA